MRILVADDDNMITLVLGEILVSKGYLVETAESAAEVRACLSKDSYDLIILDWEFPDGSGVSLIEDYRNSGGLTPLLMLTGKTETRDKEQGLDAGADDYLCKPFDERELLARLKSLLRRPQSYVGQRSTLAS